MRQIVSIVLPVLLLFLLFFVFHHPFGTAWLVVAAILLAIPAFLLGREDGKKLLMTLNILFMLLILVLFTLNKKWDQTSIAFFLNCLSVSLLFAGVELLLFSKMKRHPFLELLFLLGFWTPIAIPMFFIGQQAFGLTGGILVVAALFMIVVRDMVKRKKHLDQHQEHQGGGTDENV